MHRPALALPALALPALALPAFSLPALALPALALLALLIGTPAAAQPDEWSRAFPGHRVIGNLYAVGTYDLGCFLITSDEGWATADDAPLLEDGGASDPHFQGEYTFAPVPVDRILRDGEVIELGKTRLTVIESPGHTPGSASYTMTVAENGRDYRVAIANIGSMNPGLRLVKDPTYPGIAEDFAETFRRQKAMEVDVWVAAHASQDGLHGKYRPGDAYDPDVFVAEGFRKLVAHYQALYGKQLAAERR